MLTVRIFFFLCPLLSFRIGEINLCQNVLCFPKSLFLGLWVLLTGKNTNQSYTLRRYIFTLTCFFHSGLLLCDRSCGSFKTDKSKKNQRDTVGKEGTYPVPGKTLLPVYGMIVCHIQCLTETPVEDVSFHPLTISLQRSQIQTQNLSPQDRRYRL